MLCWEGKGKYRRCSAGTQRNDEVLGLLWMKEKINAAIEK